MTKILVIEDDAGLREDVLTWLTYEGYEVVGAADGVEGVNAALDELPDLVVCDINMPRLDGYGVLSALQSHEPTRLTPFIFLTARTSSEDLRKGMTLGADDYVTKPFERTDLLRAIGTRLNKQIAQDQAQQQQIDLFKALLEDERHQRLLQVKLVAMFSHDFRNPLTTILSSGGLLRNHGDRLDEKQRSTHWNYLESSVHQLLQMLDDMLLIAQMETGNLELSTEPLDAGQLLQTMIEELRAIHGEATRIVFDCTVSEPVRLDARLLRQIAANLISNAIKYSPAGSEVRVALNTSEDQYRLIVQDQGIGIPEADQTRLFNAFQRASNVGRIVGTGLGLAIVKQAVELQGGTIQLESQAGAGTNITVTLSPQSKP